MSAELNTAFIEKQLELAQQANTPAWLADIQQAGAQAFAQANFPTRKTEAWKYTSLFDLTKTDFSHAVSHTTSSKPASELPQIEGLNAARLIFVDGQIQLELSDTAALESISLFSQAEETQQALIQKHLGKITGEQGHLFSDLNNAALSEGLLLHVKKNQSLDQPLHIVHINNDDGCATQARLLIVAEQSSQASIIEHYVGSGSQFTNATTEIHVGNNAKVNHYRLQLMGEQAFHIGSIHVDLERDAQYESFHLALGSKLCRNDLVVNHKVGGSHSEISGVYVPQNNQHVDFHTCIEHKAAHCTSNEVFRGIMNDQAKAVFNGRIHIHKDAQKTLAELSNKNLLLTNTAEINTKPELEIYADDVKCAHGATVAQLEDKALFYLRSRGISESEAHVMLSFGFINELLDALAHDTIGDYLRPLLAQRFGRELI